MSLFSCRLFTEFFGNRLLPFSFLFLILNLGFPGLSFAQAAENHSMKVGGPCAYQRYPGTATITAISQASGAQPGLFSIRFTFSPDYAFSGPRTPPQGREYTLTVDGTSVFDREFLQRNRLEVGASLPARLDLITRGTCTPTMVDILGLQ